MNTPAVGNMIREGNEHQLYTAMQTGRSFGMQTMDSALAELYRQGLITRKDALTRAVNRGELKGSYANVFYGCRLFSVYYGVF